MPPSHLGSRRRGSWILATLLLFAPGAVPGSAPVLRRLVAGLICAKGEPDLDRSQAEVSKVGFSVRPLPPAEWEERLERASAGMGTALRPHDGGPAPFQAFLLSIENRSREVVRFQPGNVVRVLDRDKIQDHPLDYTDLYRYLTQQNKNADALGSIQDAFFDAGIVLEPGQSVERLLFFHPLPEKGWKKSLILLVSSFQAGTETYRAQLPFHVEKKRR